MWNSQNGFGGKNGSDLSLLKTMLNIMIFIHVFITYDFKRLCYIFLHQNLQTHEIHQGKNINDIILAIILWGIYQVCTSD